MLVSWNTTNQCNMYCDHCYRDAGDRLSEELSTDEAKKLILEIKKAGFKLLIFSGGESLMRPDIYELASFATQNGLRVVLGTNGTLITYEVATKMKAAGFMAVGVSLDSLDAKQNDEFRKLDNAFNLTVQGLKNLKDVGIPFQLHTTVMDWNVDELEKITDYAIEMGAMAHHFFFLVPTGRGKNIEEEALRVKTYEKTINRLMNKQKQIEIEIKPTCAPQFIRIADKKGLPHRFTKGCLAGISYCIISPKGDVQPCAYLDIPLGNVKEKAFDEIWNNNKVLKELRTMQYKGKCGYCDYKEKCGGCRARAYYYSEGDYLAEDTWCLYKPIEAIKNER
ncbi:Radical SAM heme biosynthesis protein AhbD, Fe-coproporphyrin III decarboxylase [Candidatus Syntrophocurvum alkaliphilum]|uniref:Radical SAM heme biosynthesis protein AhbD, Fe-coproporphyrin III decarboxylase n=1 Tax=Candidatus Syntrophocurvum alkaliphilum TaxID=2293317 RepID=A0A6I6DCM4_9FIRM|nr:putative heme d1 biosynthesis radical SAM protein NirJ2 [Candidatus Syntrophocurvum alkaliphilum]QGT99055.1 Radical SAM heme biosynthesis protein AhbD, Fe-coproporphyrin III decarboxylase [Candidatus Syntrophocurvum alkaliphilum]